MTKYIKEWWWSESQNCHLSQDHNGTSILCIQETRWGHWRDLITVYLCKWAVQKEKLFSEGRPGLCCNVGIEVGVKVVANSWQSVGFMEVPFTLGYSKKSLYSSDKAAEGEGGEKENLCASLSYEKQVLFIKIHCGSDCHFASIGLGLWKVMQMHWWCIRNCTPTGLCFVCSWCQWKQSSLQLI